jgi:hypothetical protein
MVERCPARIWWRSEPCKWPNTLSPVSHEWKNTLWRELDITQTEPKVSVKYSTVITWKSGFRYKEGKHVINLLYKLHPRTVIVSGFRRLIVETRTIPEQLSTHFGELQTCPAGAGTGWAGKGLFSWVEGGRGTKFAEGIACGGGGACVLTKRFGGELRQTPIHY